jgi:hypothetical protein
MLAGKIPRQIVPRRGSLFSFLKSGSSRVACAVIFSCITLALCGPPTASARVAKAGPVIACFHGKAGRYSAQAHPSRCNFRGYHGRQLVGVSVKGMNWGHWGSNPTRGAYGTDRNDGKPVQIIAYRPVVCGEGRKWYSRIIVLSYATGNYITLRLPTCNGRFETGQRRARRPGDLTT